MKDLDSETAEMYIQQITKHYTPIIGEGPWDLDYTLSDYQLKILKTLVEDVVQRIRHDVPDFNPSWRDIPYWTWWDWEEMLFGFDTREWEPQIISKRYIDLVYNHDLGSILEYKALETRDAIMDWFIEKYNLERNADLFRNSGAGRSPWKLRN